MGQIFKTTYSTIYIFGKKKERREVGKGCFSRKHSHRRPFLLPFYVRYNYYSHTIFAWV